MDKVMQEARQDSIDVEEAGRSARRSISTACAVEVEDAPVVKIVNLILVQALKEKASDIHIEPFEKQLNCATGSTVT